MERNTEINMSEWLLHSQEKQANSCSWGLKKEKQTPQQNKLHCKIKGYALFTFWGK